MARYGVSEYGRAFYGAPALALFSAAPVTGVVTDYGSVHLTWHSPGGTWDQLRLVRNLHGYPVAVDNGITVLTAAAGADPAEFRESGLPTDRWVYYTIFVHDNTQDEWILSGRTRMYSPANYRSAERLAALAPPIAQSDALLKFLQVFGFATDVMRNDANSLLDLYDSHRLLYDFVPVAMEQFGVPPEVEIEPEQYRRFLRNAVRFYKTKGTQACVHGVVSAVTGWDSDISIGTNLLYDADLSDFVGGFGLWDRGAVNCTVGWVPPSTDSYGQDVPAAMRLTAVANGDLHTTFAPIADVRFLAINVKAGREYSAGAEIRASDVAQSTAHLDIAWYDLGGNLLSVSTDVAVPTWKDVDTPVEISAIAPINAVWMVPIIAVDDAVAGSHWDVRLVRVNESPTSLPHQPGRDIRIALLADRVNEIDNASFENGVAGWVEHGDVDLVVDDTKSFVGLRSARVTYTGTGISGSSPPMDCVAFTFDTVPGRRYGVQLEVALDDSADPGAVNNLIAQAVVTNTARTSILTDSDGSNARFSSGSSGVQEFDGDHFQPSFAFVADSTEASLLVGFNRAATGHAFNVDAIVAERADIGTSDDWYGRNPAVVRPYFDGSFTSITADYFWEGAEFNSRSHFYSRMSVHRDRLNAVLPRYLPFGATYTLLFAPAPRPFYISDDIVLVTTDVEPTAPVGRDLDIEWRQRFTDAAILAVRYRDLVPVGASVSLEWNQRAAVNKSEQIVWNDLHTTLVLDKGLQSYAGPGFSGAWQGDLGVAFRFQVKSTVTAAGIRLAQGFVESGIGGGGSYTYTGAPVRGSILDASGNVLASGTVTKSFLGSSTDPAEWDFGTPVTLVPGVEYFIAWDWFHTYPAVTGTNAATNGAAVLCYKSDTQTAGFDPGVVQAEASTVGHEVSVNWPALPASQSQRQTDANSLDWPAIIAGTQTYPSWLSHGSGPVPRTFAWELIGYPDATIVDNFNRADGGLGTTSDGQAIWNPLTGSFRIVTNRAFPPLSSGGTAVDVDPGSANGTLQVTIGAVESGQICGIVFRALNSNSYWMMMSNGWIRRYDSGTLSGVLLDIGETYAAGDVMKVVLNGNVINVYKNGVLKGTITNSTYASATRHGMHASDTGAHSATWLDDFSFTA